MRMYGGYASQESYLPTFAIVFVNIIADTTRLSSLEHKIMHECYILLASHIIVFRSVISWELRIMFTMCIKYTINVIILLSVCILVVYLARDIIILYWIEALF